MRNLNTLYMKKSALLAIAAVVAIFVVFGGYAAYVGDLQTPLIWGVISLVVIAAIVVGNYWPRIKQLW